MGTTKTTEPAAPMSPAISPELIVQGVVAGAVIFSLLVSVLVGALVLTSNDANRTAREAVQKCARGDR